MNSFYTYWLEFLSLLQPYAEIIALLDKSQTFSTLTAAGITASLLYILFYVPKFSILFDIKRNKKGIDHIILAIKNRKYFITFAHDDVYMHFWIPKNLFNSEARFGMMPHPSNPRLEITEYVENGTRYFRLSAIQPFPMFPRTETATVIISGDFNLTRDLKHNIYYYFSTRHGYYPRNTLRRLNPLRLPKESILIVGE